MADNLLQKYGSDGPKFDLVGPTVDDDVRRIVSRYGADAVKAAFKRVAKPKPGRRPEKDWPELRPVIEADAESWLLGGDPFTDRSNYSIAKAFADANPGHSHPGTMKRILRKLGKSRKWMTYVTAYQMSEEDYPYGLHLRALEAANSVSERSLFEGIIRFTKSDIADFEAKFGDSPPPTMSLAEIRRLTRNALLPALPVAQRRGIFGAITNLTSNRDEAN